MVAGGTSGRAGASPGRWAPQALGLESPVSCYICSMSIWQRIRGIVRISLSYSTLGLPSPQDDLEGAPFLGRV